MNAPTMHMDIVTPEGAFYADEVVLATLETADGHITILPHHVPLVSLLKAGEMQFQDREGSHVFAISGGCLEMGSDNHLLILADHVERAEAIDLDRAEAARERAEQMMHQAKQREDVDYARLQAVLDREANRIRVGKKYRRI